MNVQTPSPMVRPPDHDSEAEMSFRPRLRHGLLKSLSTRQFAAFRARIHEERDFPEAHGCEEAQIEEKPEPAA
jgi:hypothetical protein